MLELSLMSPAPSPYSYYVAMHCTFYLNAKEPSQGLLDEFCLGTGIMDI